MVFLDKKYQQCDNIHTSGEASALVSELTDYMATHEDQQEARIEQVRGEELIFVAGEGYVGLMYRLEVYINSDGSLQSVCSSCSWYSMVLFDLIRHK